MDSNSWLVKTVGWSTGSRKLGNTSEGELDAVICLKNVENGVKP